MKKISIILICLLVLSGCQKELSNNLETSKGNCSVFDCIQKITVEDSVNDINEIIGIQGEKLAEDDNTYYWELSDTTGIEVTYNSYNKGTVKAVYDKEMLENKKVDFSRYDSLQKRVNEGIDYRDFISYLGNVDGTIIEKNSVTTKYSWVDKEGRYLNATFSNSSGKCTFILGRI